MDSRLPRFSIAEALNDILQPLSRMKLPSSRLKLILFASIASVAAVVAVRAADQPEKYTYVIVHGATAGGYEWKETGKYLLENDHTVYRVTLTALGERSHLSAEGVNLTTHINDVVNTILFEDLHDVVLTGHSYGGRVITGVMNRIPERIRHVMFFDASVPEDGETAFGRQGGPPRPGGQERPEDPIMAERESHDLSAQCRPPHRHVDGAGLL
jgi:pimeloyl-ACP methyl ester carboxylesterase